MMNHPTRKLLISDKLRLAITSSCNYTCEYCHNEGQKHQTHDTMSIAYVEAMVEWLTRQQIFVDKISLTGGEPLYHPSILKIVELCAPLANHVSISTNGALLTRENTDRLIDRGVDTLKIGVDTLFNPRETKPNAYENISSVDAVREAIEYASSKSVSVTMNVVVTQFNYSDIDGMISFARSLGHKSIKILQLHDFDARGLDYQYSNVAMDDGVDLYESVLNRYLNVATLADYSKEKGRTDLTLSDGLKVCFCEDICKAKVCGHMHTCFNAKGNMVICPRYQVEEGVDFIDFGRGHPDKLREQIQRLQEKRCQPNRVFDYPDCSLAIEETA
jgi:Molybdenum cofactor biosynthesis enzyme